MTGPKAKPKPKPNHPRGYDIDMEVLASLPKAPAGAKLVHLRKTVGLAHVRDVAASLGRLMAVHGYYIYQGDFKRHGGGGVGVGGGLRASIQAKSWQAAQAAAEAYWDKVHHDDDEQPD